MNPQRDGFLKGHGGERPFEPDGGAQVDRPQQRDEKGFEELGGEQSHGQTDAERHRGAARVLDVLQDLVDQNGLMERRRRHMSRTDEEISSDLFLVFKKTI